MRSSLVEIYRHYWCMLALLSAKCEMLVVDMVVVGRDILLLLVYVDVVVS